MRIAYPLTVDTLSSMFVESAWYSTTKAKSPRKTKVSTICSTRNANAPLTMFFSRRCFATDVILSAAASSSSGGLHQPPGSTSDNASDEENTEGCTVSPRRRGYVRCEPLHAIVWVH